MRLGRLHHVWTAIVRSDREARTTDGVAFLSGIGSLWPWAVLAWPTLLVAIIVSFRPAVPVIWGDTPSATTRRAMPSGPGSDSSVS